MHEVNEAAEVITSSIDSNAKVIFGAVVDELLGDEIKITVIATGFSSSMRESEPERTVSNDKVFTSSIAPVSTDSASVKNDDKHAVFVKSIFSKKAKTVVPDQVELPPATKEEEELDIPAFIRKKMGK